MISTISFEIVSVLLIFSLYFSSIEGKPTNGIELRDSNWMDMLQGEWMVKFYAPWCPACRNLEPTWASLANWAVGKEVSVGHVDVTEEPGLSGRFIITSLPTIYHVVDGEFRVYTGPRTLDDFLTFLEEKKWKETSSISWWKSPSSTLMGYVSTLFQLSMHLKNLHNALTDTYGVPVWASFVLFGVLVVLLGLLLGVVLVLITDYTFGPPGTSANAAEESETDRELTNEKEDIKEDAERTVKSESDEFQSEDIPNQTDDHLRKRKAKPKASTE